MKITEIRSAGLRGATPPGGWTAELRPADCVHTLGIGANTAVFTRAAEVLNQAGPSTTA